MACVIRSLFLVFRLVLALVALPRGRGLPDDILEDKDFVIWISCYREVKMLPGLVQSVRRHHKHAPMLVVVDGGGATTDFARVCENYGCTVVEWPFWLGLPTRNGRPVPGHNFTCDAWMSKFEPVLSFAPDAKWLMYLEPDNRMLAPLRKPRTSHEMFQFGNLANYFAPEVHIELGALPDFPTGYSTAGGTLMARTAVLAMLGKVPALMHLLEKYPQYSETDTCLFMLAGLAKVSLSGSDDIMQATESCGGSSGVLYPCYRCIHTCKLHEQCYQSGDWIKSPGYLAPFVHWAYYAVAQPVCWVSDEPCVCLTDVAVRRANACIQGCRYTCPAILHNLMGARGSFVDCHVNASAAIGMSGHRVEI